MPTNPNDLVLVLESTQTMANAMALVLEHLGRVPVFAARWNQARTLLAAPAIGTLIATCHLIGDSDGEPALVSAGKLRPDLALIATCTEPAHQHAQLPPRCTVLRVPFDAAQLKDALGRSRA